MGPVAGKRDSPVRLVLRDLALDLDPPPEHVAHLGDARPLLQLFVLLLDEVGLPVNPVLVVTQELEYLVHGPVNVDRMLRLDHRTLPPQKPASRVNAAGADSSTGQI